MGYFIVIIEATITIGNIIEISVLAVGGIIAIVTMKNHVTFLKTEVTEIKTEFGLLKNDIRDVRDGMSKLAVTDARLAGVEQDVRELRHGRGFVQGDINGEWPRKS